VARKEFETFLGSAKDLQCAELSAVNRHPTDTHTIVAVNSLSGIRPGALNHGEA
jgi:hypothetical protein